MKKDSYHDYHEPTIDNDAYDLHDLHDLGEILDEMPRGEESSGYGGDYYFSNQVGNDHDVVSDEPRRQRRRRRRQRRSFYDDEEEDQDEVEVADTKEHRFNHTVVSTGVVANMNKMKFLRVSNVVSAH